MKLSILGNFDDFGNPYPLPWCPMSSHLIPDLRRVQRVCGTGTLACAPSTRGPQAPSPALPMLLWHSRPRLCGLGFSGSPGSPDRAGFERGGVVIRLTDHPMPHPPTLGIPCHPTHPRLAAGLTNIEPSNCAIDTTCLLSFNIERSIFPKFWQTSPT